MDSQDELRRIRDYEAIREICRNFHQKMEHIYPICMDLDGDCMLCSRVWFSPSSIGPRPRRTRSRNGPNGTSTVNGCNGRGVPASLLYGMPTENILIHLRVDIARHVRQAVRAEEEGLNVEILECDIESNVKTRKLLDIVEAGHVSLMRLKGIENGAGETNDY